MKKLFLALALVFVTQTGAMEDIESKVPSLKQKAASVCAQDLVSHPHLSEEARAKMNSEVQEHVALAFAKSVAEQMLNVPLVVNEQRENIGSMENCLVAADGTYIKKQIGFNNRILIKPENPEETCEINASDKIRMIARYKNMLVVDEGKILAFWDISTKNAQLIKVDNRQNNALIMSLRFSNDGKKLAVLSLDNRITIIDTEKLAVIKDFAIASFPNLTNKKTKDLANWSPDNRAIVIIDSSNDSNDNDKLISIWDLEKAADEK